MMVVTVKYCISNVFVFVCQVEEQRTKRLSEIGAVERHIMQAQAKAMSADEREINRITDSCNGYDGLGVPPGEWIRSFFPLIFPTML